LKRWWIAVVLALAVLGQGTSALADDKAEAKRHFDLGIGLITAEPKDYAAALVEFQASVRLYPTRTGLYNLGLCYRRLARYGEALAAFERLEREFGHSMSESLKKDVEWEVQAIRRLTVQLTVTVSHPGATIRLGGEIIGRSPLTEPLILGPRERWLEVELAGFEPVRRKLSLTAGQRHEEKVQLQPLMARLMVSTGSVTGAVVAVDGQPIAVTPLTGALSITPGQHEISVSKEGYEPSPPQRIFVQGGGSAVLSFQLLEPMRMPAGPAEPEPDHGQAMLEALPWFGVGLTAASGVFAGVFWQRADTRHDDFVFYDDQVSSGAVRAGDHDAAWIDGERQSAADDTETFNAVAVGATVTTGVFAVATALLFALDPFEDDGRDAALSSGPGTLTLRF
jgi:hypothetical protein